MSSPAAALVEPAASWRAELTLDFDATPVGSRLASRKHRGPLVVQRALYPEGPAVCHAIVVHPPGGIAGGDALALQVNARAGAHALLTTPGASKLYKSAGRLASQRVSLTARECACVEWLPQETIVFDAADALLELDIDLRDGATAIAWEIATLGREAMGERFASGRLRSRMTVRHDGRLVLFERGSVAGGAPWLDSPVGWRGARACGTFVIAGFEIDDGRLDEYRTALAPWPGHAALSRPMKALLVARYLGPSATEARAAFVALWEIVRPAATGRVAVPPRIWST